MLFDERGLFLDERCFSAANVLNIMELYNIFYKKLHVPGSLV